MKSVRLAFLACLLSAALSASERAIVPLTCPLDGTTFEAVQDFSGYAEGQRLDLKKLGPISQPPALARCPQCGFPLFTKHPDAAETERLRAIVASERFRTEARPASAWFALGVLREELRAEPFAIAWTYLNASWEAEEEDAAAYPRAAERALAWFDRAAVALREQTDRSHDYHIALYLPAELARRLGRFAEARERLSRLEGVQAPELPWFEAAKLAQARLIAERDPSPDDGRVDLHQPPP